jgi:hypothetical protein
MDKKMEYVEKLSAQMVEWDAQIDLLKFKADSAMNGAAKSEYCKEIDALLSKRKEAELKLQGISTASDDMWEELKAGTESIWDETRTALHAAILKIK